MPEDRGLTRLQQKWGPLSRRTINVLIRAGVTPERLATMTDWQLRALKDVGPTAFHDIRAAYPGLPALAPAPRSAARGPDGRRP